MSDIKINLDNEKFIKENMPLLKDLEERDYDLRKQHNSNFLVFIWFLIATAWVVISLNNVTLRTRNILVFSIISFVIWFFFSFLHSEISIQKFWKTMESLLKFSSIDSITWMVEELNNSNKIWEESGKERFYKYSYMIFQNLWMLLFISWLIIFIISLWTQS